MRTPLEYVSVKFITSIIYKIKRKIDFCKQKLVVHHEITFHRCCPGRHDRSPKPLQ